MPPSQRPKGKGKGVSGLDEGQQQSHQHNAAGQPGQSMLAAWHIQGPWMQAGTPQAITADSVNAAGAAGWPKMKVIRCYQIAACQMCLMGLKSSCSVTVDLEKSLDGDEVHRMLKRCGGRDATSEVDVRQG